MEYLQIDFTIAHTQGKMNTATDFSTSLEMDPKEKIFLKIREDIPTSSTEVNIESTSISQEEPALFDTTEIDFWKLKEEARHAIPNDPRAITVSCRYANDPKQRHSNCEYIAINKMITYTHRKRFRSNIAAF